MRSNISGIYGLR